MISGAQIRAARALIGISAAELASLAGVGHRTLQRFEAFDAVPDGRTAVLLQIIRALEDAGVEFIGDPVTSPGVQLKRRPSQLSSGTRKSDGRLNLRHRYRKS